MKTSILLAVPDTHLANWRAANFIDDDILDVFDLTLMKRALIEKPDIDPNDDPDVYELLFGYYDKTMASLYRLRDLH